jgi:hypothetical protein
VVCCYCEVGSVGSIKEGKVGASCLKILLLKENKGIKTLLRSYPQKTK